MDRRARLRIVRQPTRFFSVMPAVRWAAALLLSVSLVAGAGRWLGLERQAGALEFTPRTVGVATSAVGVKDVIARDINKDSAIDIITAGDDGVKIYENTGDWKFALHVIDDKAAERVLTADLDKDADVDLVVSFRGGSPSARWYRNRGDFEFSSTSLATAGADALVGAGDVDADGAIDIVTASGGETKTIERWMNNGSAVFSSTTVTTTSKATSLVVGDLSGSGYADMVTGSTAGLQRWSTSNGTTWTRVDIDDSNQNRSHLALATPPAGNRWIVTGDATDNEVVLYRSGLTSETKYSFGRKFLDTEADAKTVAAADLDGDGDLDILAAAQDTNEVYWYKNDGLDNFTRQTLATNLQSVFGVAAADMDSDGDLDVITADQMRGTVYVYERVRQKPTATAPSAIQQGSNGSGLVTFETTISDEDAEATRLRIQYSVDGDHWYKPWLTQATVDVGSVDLTNSQGYQVGTKNAVDTNTNAEVKVTLTWDTKSSENTGGPIAGDVGSVQLRVIPRDARDIGVAALSAKFRVDNKAPEKFTLKLEAMGADNATLSWTRPTDSSDFSYALYYGTDATAVIERRSDVWKGTDEAPLSDSDTLSTTIPDLKKNTLYTFKLFATDEFGNSAGAPSAQGRTSEPSQATPTPGPGGSEEPPPLPPPAATPDTSSPAIPTPTPSVAATPTPTPPLPPAIQSNNPPVADAGPDQVVNPRALVILDGIASFDPDPGDSATLTYNWRQIDGPTVELLSGRTGTPSFSAGPENETYIFALTVRDVQGASAIDTVTIATKTLPQSPTVDVEIESLLPTAGESVSEESPLISTLLRPADLFLLLLSLLSTGILLVDRLSHGWYAGSAGPAVRAAMGGANERTQSRVVHYKTGEPIAGANVLIYGEDGKLRAQERTNAQGSFASFFPPGVYTLGVRVDGFTFAPAATKSIAPTDSIVYSGGRVTVKDANHPLSIIVPMKPTATEVTNVRVRLLRAWQTIQHLGRVLSWPLFLAGAMLNTVLVFLAPDLLYLVIEVVYVVLVIVKIAVEIRMRPAYGLVRDAITHIPLELAVVRLLESGTNRLVMTRVTNTQGKFFALPPAGTYTITFSKPGYGTFTKEGVEIVSDHDTTLQVTADLMPIAPAPGMRGLTQARAATL